MLRTSLVRTLTKQGKLDEAIAVRREEVRRRPDDVEARYGLSLALREAARYDESLANRYLAARAAALARSGQGETTSPSTMQPTSAATSRHWPQLTPIFSHGRKLWPTPDRAPPQRVTQALMHWKADPDLAALRDPAALAKLPEDEQKACRTLWSDVDSLLAKLAPKPSP